MADAQALIDASLRKLGVLGSGESPTSQQGTDALAELNRLIQTWMTQALMIHGETLAEHTLTASQQSHSIGKSAANLSARRPDRVVRANILDTSGEDILAELKIENMQWWADIRPSSDTDSLPSTLVYNATYPNGTIYLSPSPDSAYVLELFTWGEIGEIAAVSTTISLPPGYEDLIVYELAERLIPDYGANPGQAFFDTLRDIRARVKGHNVRPREMYSDYPGVRRTKWDINTNYHR